VIAALSLAPRSRWIVVSGDADVGIRKPRPGVFALALERAGCEPREALHVGDSPANDIGGAAAAGMRTCRIGDAAAYPDGIRRPDLTLGAVAELPGRLGGPRD